jgi:hypothetical protein
MVKSRIDESKSSNKSKNKENKNPRKDRKIASDTSNSSGIITCLELEAATKSKSAQKNLRKVKRQHSIKDPAIMQFAVRPDTKMKYDKEELMSLKNSQLSQSPPSCLYNPKIIRLNILKYTPDHSEDYESQMKSFRELLPKLSLSNWNPSILDLLNNYHRSLLYPQFNYTDNSYNSVRMDQNNNNSSGQGKQRRVSWSDQKQIDSQYYANLPTYDQKNFFDNITTATTMRPPPPPRAPRNQQFRQSKGFSCASERLSGYPMNVSTGSCSINETKSSYDESMDRTASSLNSESDLKRENIANKGAEESNEPEPEWFSCPASRNDVIELHGFEDDAEFRDSPSDISDKTGKMDSSTNSGVVTGHSNRNQNYNRPHRNYNHFGMNSNYRSQPQYHHPLQQSTPYSSFNSSGEMNFMNMSKNQFESRENQTSPFFDMWKRKNNNFGNMNMRPPQAVPGFNPVYNKPRNMLTISDVEQAMRNAEQFLKQPRTAPLNGVVQQMFQNAAINTGLPNFFPPPPQIPSAPMTMPTYGFDRFQPGSVPTQEQLHQHTSEILRNAILRKHPYNQNDSK